MNTQKTLKMIREWEEELLFAEPKRAAKLASKIVKYKSTLFIKSQ